MKYKDLPSSKTGAIQRLVLGAIVTAYKYGIILEKDDPQIAERYYFWLGKLCLGDSARVFKHKHKNLNRTNNGKKASRYIAADNLEFCFRIFYPKTNDIAGWLKETSELLKTVGVQDIDAMNL